MQAKMLKLVPSCTADDSINQCNPFGKWFSNANGEAKKKKKVFVPFNPEILLLRIHPKEIIYNKDEAISQSITYNGTKLQEKNLNVH